jgi:integrase
MLTKSLIDGAGARAARYVLWDGTLPGFGLRHAPSGRRVFILSYRLPGSRQAVTATIGAYGSLTLPQARKRAEELLARVRLGGDPQAEANARAAQAQELTVAALVQRYIAALASGTAVSRRLRGRTACADYHAAVVRHLERFAAAYGPHPAQDITRGDVVRCLAEYAHQPFAHRHMHGAVHRMYVWARQHELVTNRPTEDIETAASPARERVLSLAELTQLWRAGDGLNPLYRDYLHLLISTGQRRTEVAGMRWGEIDLTRGLWTLPAGRTKARRGHTIPLPPLAVAVLQARRNALAHAPAATDLVLPAISQNGRAWVPISGWNWFKRELDKRVPLAEPWRLHDVRRSLVTHCAEAGADVAVLDSLLNHALSATRGGVIGVYQRATLLEPMRRVMALWDRLLRDALIPLGGLASMQEKVVPLRV